MAMVNECEGWTVPKFTFMEADSADSIRREEARLSRINGMHRQGNN